MTQRTVLIALVLVLAPSTVSSAAVERDGIGIRGGVAREPGQAVLGGQVEVGPVLGPSLLVPSVDLQLGDDRTLVVANADLRWYLLPLPDTGIYFYGAGGPGVALGGDQSALGLSLVAGANIPMRAGRRYNLEARFGFGSLPDLKLLLAVVWGL